MTTMPQQSPGHSPRPASARRRGPYLTALVWGDLGMLAGAATAVLVALPFYPHDDDGWEALGWAILVAGLGALLGLVVGAAALWRGLRRSGAAHPLGTTAAFVPLALVLAAFTAGTGALVAPPLAHWLVGSVARRRGGRSGGSPAALGYGPAGHRPSAPLG